MGFSAPKPNKALEQAQTQEAERAKQDRISQIQQQLQGEDEARAQFYGTPASTTAANGTGGYGTGGYGNGYGGYGGGWGGFGSLGGFSRA